MSRPALAAATAPLRALRATRTFTTTPARAADKPSGDDMRALTSDFLAKLQTRPLTATPGADRFEAASPAATEPRRRQWGLDGAVGAAAGRTNAAERAGEAGAPSSSRLRDAATEARAMIGSGTFQAQREARVQFQSNEMVSPYTFREENLYRSDAPKPRVSQPLLGPPAPVAKRIDPFHLSRTSPLDHAMNPHMVNAFVDNLGRLKPRAKTGLTWKSQRLVGKMVRRARAMGVVSKWASVSRPGALGNEH